MQDFKSQETAKWFFRIVIVITALVGNSSDLDFILGSCLVRKVQYLHLQYTRSVGVLLDCILLLNDRLLCQVGCHGGANPHQGSPKQKHPDSLQKTLFRIYNHHPS